MEKASNLNLAANQAFAAFTLAPQQAGASAPVALTPINLMKIKGGCGDSGNVGDKRRRRTGG